MNTTWEDETSDGNDENPESDKPNTGKGKFIAFMERRNLLKGFNAMSVKAMDILLMTAETKNLKRTL